MKPQRSAYDVMRDHAFKDSDLLGIGYVIVFLFVVFVLSSTDDYSQVFEHSASNGQSSNKIQPSCISATDHQYAPKSIQRQGGDGFVLNDSSMDKNSDLDPREAERRVNGDPLSEPKCTNDSIEAEIRVVPVTDPESEVIGYIPSDESDKARYGHQNIICVYL